MENMELYNKFREVPETAKKQIQGGRLKGKTDINPMWRIKVLTEQFGPCGVGWKTEIVKLWLEQGNAGEVSAWAQINLYVCVEGVWSDPIPGIGGAMYVAKESGGLYTDDEAYKKAYTDAISVACKALGVAADVYYQNDSTKYSPRTGATAGDKTTTEQQPVEKPTQAQIDEATQLGMDLAKVATYFKVQPDALTGAQLAQAIKTKRAALAKKTGGNA